MYNHNPINTEPVDFTDLENYNPYHHDLVHRYYVPEEDDIHNEVLPDPVLANQYQHMPDEEDDIYNDEHHPLAHHPPAHSHYPEITKNKYILTHWDHEDYPNNHLKCTLTFNYYTDENNYVFTMTYLESYHDKSIYIHSEVMQGFFGYHIPDIDHFKQFLKEHHLRSFQKDTIMYYPGIHVPENIEKIITKITNALNAENQLANLRKAVITTSTTPTTSAAQQAMTLASNPPRRMMEFLYNPTTTGGRRKKSRRGKNSKRKTRRTRK
jgi:hypothetical protein